MATAAPASPILIACGEASILRSARLGPFAVTTSSLNGEAAPKVPPQAEGMIAQGTTCMRRPPCDCQFVVQSNAVLPKERLSGVYGDSKGPVAILRPNQVR